MAVWNEIGLSYMACFNRSDAEFFKPEYERAFEKVSRCSGERLCRMASITDGIHASPDIVGDGANGICYISAKCVKDNEFSTDGCIFISEKQHLGNPRTQLRKHDVIITTVGTIGNVAVVDDELVPSNSDRHVGIVRIRDQSGLSPFYLSTFLNSSYGRFQSLREAAGNVQLSLYIRNIGNIVVPRFPSQEGQISELTKGAYELRRSSRQLYTQAQQLLEVELGLDKFRFEEPVGYTAQFSELESSLRFDPEHFYPTFKKLCASLPKSVSLEPLYRFSQRLKTGIQPRYLKDGEYEVINSKHVCVNKIDDSTLRRAAPAPRHVMAEIGDVLLNATGRGTLGRCAVVDSHGPRIFDVCIIRIRPVGLDPYFLSALLNTRFGQLQMELHTRGTSGQLHLYPRDAARILIWPAPESLQAEVRELMTKAARLAEEANQLLDQAKSRVEQLIEEAVRP